MDWLTSAGYPHGNHFLMHADTMGCAASVKPTITRNNLYATAKYGSPEELGYQIDTCYQLGLVQLAEGSRQGSPTPLCFKIYPPDLVNADEMAREVVTLMDLSQSDFFPAYKGLLVHQRSPIVITARHPRLHLLQTLPDLTQKERQRLLKGVFSAVKYCHCRAIVLCALNPDAIKLTFTKVEEDRKFSVQIVDLTVSVRLDERPTVGQLTRRAVWGHYLSHYERYIAPELKAVGPALQEVITASVDVWSMGMIGALILHGAVDTSAEQIDTSMKISKSHLKVIAQLREMPKAAEFMGGQLSTFHY